MKIAWVSNSPLTPTGFGQQVRLTADSLAKLGHENVILCRPHAVQGPRTHEEIHLTDYVCDPIDESLAQIKPDVVICLEGHQLLINLMGMRITPANCPVYFWWPYEGSCVPEDMADVFSGVPHQSMVHLSQFAKNMWKHGDTVIGHAADPAFRRLEDAEKIPLRKKWAKKFKLPIFHDTLLIFNINRNFIHKGWDKLIYLVKLLKDKGVDVQLLCHTEAARQENMGGKDIPKIARAHGVSDEVMFTKGDLTPADINEIMNMSDLRIDMSGGEGFGLTVLEAYQAGLPQLVTDHTTMREILVDEPQCIVPPTSYSFYMNTTWADPDVSAMADLIVQGEPGEYNESEGFIAPLDIAARWDVKLRGSSYDHWKHCRFGMHHQHRHTVRMQAVARLCKAMKWKAFEVGSFDGCFLDWCQVFNVKAGGLETEANLGNVKKSVVDLIKVGQYTDPWPEDADTLVMTDVQDLVFGEASGGIVDDLLQRIQKFDHVLISLLPCFKWGQQRFSPDQLRTYLEAGGLTRNEDAELIMRKKLPLFKHEIWSVTPVKIPKDLT